VKEWTRPLRLALSVMILLSVVVVVLALARRSPDAGSSRIATTTAAPASPGQRPAAPCIWVAQPPHALFALDRDLATVGRVELPPFAFEDPTRISVNARGQILVRVTSDSVWIWDGAQWRSRSRPPNPHYLAPTAFTTGSCNRTWLLGAADSSLFMLETSTVVWSGGDEPDSAYLAARLEETDFELHPRGLMFDHPYARCEDSPSPGADFSDACSEARVTAPGGVVSDFLVLTQQRAVEPRSPRSVAVAEEVQSIFVHDPGGWRLDSLSLSGDAFFDRGRTQVGSSADGACCGWANKSSNSSWVVRNGVVTTFFDEWARYRNQDYDISFFADRPMPSPDRRAVAYTIRADGELRLSANGHADTLELQRVNAALAELPVVEVDGLEPSPATLRRAVHAELAGWLDPNVVLLVVRGELTTCDVRTGARRATGIRVRGAKDVFVLAP
jgi:hypothetical protein